MRIVGQEEIAAVFGVAPKTIVDWQGQGFPIAERGGPGVPSEYETADCIAWLVRREVEKVQGERPQDRLARVQADKIEMENAEKRGQLVSAALLEPKLQAIAIAAREGFRNEPAALSRKVVGKPIREIEEMLAAAFDRFLARLARMNAAAPDVLEDEEGDAE